MRSSSSAAAPGGNSRGLDGGGAAQRTAMLGGRRSTSTLRLRGARCRTPACPAGRPGGRRGRAAIEDSFQHWDDIDGHVRGHVFTSDRARLQRHRAQAAARHPAGAGRGLGVDVRFEQARSRRRSDVNADLIVACDGVGNWVRDALAAQFEPDVDVRPSKFVWLGTDGAVHRVHLHLQGDPLRPVPGARLSLQPAPAHLHRRGREDVDRGGSRRHRRDRMPS